MKNPILTDGPKRARKIVAETLFDLVKVKTAGMRVELPSDPVVVEKIAKAFEKSIALLKRIDPKSRAELIRRITRALGDTSPAVACVAFRRDKQADDDDDDLFAT